MARQAAARKTGTLCGDCGRTFDTDYADLARFAAFAPRVGRYVRCHSCAGVDEGDAEVLAGDSDETWKCCGCEVAIVHGKVLRVRYPYWRIGSDDPEWFDVCSERCRQRVYGRLLRGQHPQTGDRSCARCGLPMEGRRADTRYCSTRCRVAAHRRSGSG